MSSGATGAYNAPLTICTCSLEAQEAFTCCKWPCAAGIQVPAARGPNMIGL